MRIEAETGNPAPRWRRLLVAATLCAITLVAYSNSFHTGFTLDNQPLVLRDTRLRQATGENLGLILRHTYWWVQGGESGLYRPVTTASYLFNYAVLGNQDRPAGYHWLNFLLHAGNVLLVYALALRLMRRFWPAWFTAALWAVHPVLTESVTNIIGRSDLLAAMTLLSGLLMYLKSTETAGLRRLAWLAGLMAVTAVGVFSKESAVAIVGVIALYEIAWWKGRKQLRGLVLGCLALAPPLLAMWYVRSIVFAGSSPPELPFVDNPMVAADFWTARLTAIEVMARYLGLMVWPGRLSCDYSYAQIPLAIGSLQDWIAWTVVTAVVVAVLLQLGRNRLWFFFAAFAFVTFVPVSNLVFPVGTIMAERFLYLPCIGFAACLVLAVDAAGRRSGVRALAPVALCLIMAGFAIRTWARNLDWENDFTLWTAASRASPHSFKCHKALAIVLLSANLAHPDIGRVIEEAEKCLAILDPLPDSLNSGLDYMRAGGYYRVKGDLLLRPGPDGKMVAPPESIRAYRRSLAILTRGVSIDRAYNNWNLETERARGKPESQIAVTGYPELYRELSLTWLRLSDLQKAYDAAAYARALTPTDPTMYLRMADILLTANNKEQAAVALVEGMMLTGDRSVMEALRNLYRSGLDPKGCAIAQSANGPSLNAACESVQKHLCAASADMMRTYLQMRRPEPAAHLKTTALFKYGCPAGPLNQILPEGPVF